MKINTALILCAGFGKRLNPLTLDTPKPLIELKNVSVFIHSGAEVAKLETCKLKQYINMKIENEQR